MTNRSFIIYPKFTSLNYRIGRETVNLKRLRRRSFDNGNDGAANHPK
jgi:hypothetical protein